MPCREYHVGRSRAGPRPKRVPAETQADNAMHMGGVGFGSFLIDLFVIFMFVPWIWLLIAVFSDLFRRHDIPGGAKVLWVIFLIVLPYLGVLASVLTQGAAWRSASRLERRRPAQTFATWSASAWPTRSGSSTS